MNKHENKATVIIRDVEARDIPAIKAIISEVWNWVALIEDKDILSATLGLYMNQTLYEATFGRVAVLDENVVGVIFGSVDGQPHNYRIFQEDGTAHALTLLGADEMYRESIHEFFAKTNAAYERLVSGLPDNYDGTLDFLILSKAAQGLGAGKGLWLELKAYFEKHSTEAIYLFTDTECNFGFYEHQGFRRKGEDAADFVFGGESYKMPQFLYEYQFNGGKNNG